MPQKQDYSMPLGDGRAIPYSAVNDDATATTPATPYNATGQTVVLTITAPGTRRQVIVKRSDAGGITITTPLGCIGTINMAGADQVGVASGSYAYDVVAIDAGGVRTTLTEGAWTFTDHASA